ncbi:MAG: Maebl [Oscillospiraceae bacterium]|nr:Maebl [Oscillospiraceae bacterium]
MANEFADLRLAILIDADNAPRTALKDIMSEVTVYGTPTIKRIYGDWTAPNMGSWKTLLLEHAIAPVQQYSYTTGKNATDSAMIIDAMDILYAGNCEGFVLVSSDSDFTRLATRLREAGKKVFGLGERKTPQPFIAACDKFSYIEVIRAASEAARTKELPKQEQKKQPRRKIAEEEQEPDLLLSNESSQSEFRLPSQVTDLIVESVENLASEDGFANMAPLGNLLVKKQPDFDPRNFGFSKLSKLIRSLDRFEIDERLDSKSSVQLYVRDTQK